MIKRLVFLLLALAVFKGQAAAATLQEVEVLYRDGHFAETILEGRKLATVEGLNLAVRAQLILVQYVLDPEIRRAAIDVAVADAKAALEKNPDNLEATINLGIIIGLRGKYERSIPDGKESRDLFQEAVDMDPASSWSLGVLASWNADTVDQAGSVAGRLIFGAKKKRAWELFEQAIAAEPTNLTIRAAYVRALLKLKPKNYLATAEANIGYILKENSDNALEDIMKTQVSEIKKALDAGNSDRLKLLLDEMVALEPAAEQP